MSAASITPLLQRSPLPPHRQDILHNNNLHNNNIKHNNNNHHHHPSFSLTDQNDEIDIDYYDDGGGGAGGGHSNTSDGRVGPPTQLTDTTTTDTSSRPPRQKNFSVASIASNTSATAAARSGGGGGKRNSKRYQIRTVASLDSLQNIYNRNNKIDIADPSDNGRINNDIDNEDGIRAGMASASSGRFETPPSSPNQSMNGNRGCCFCWRPSLRNSGIHGNTLQPGGPPSSATFGGGGGQPTSESSSSSHSSRLNKQSGNNQGSADSAPSYDEVLDWGKNFEKLMKSPRGRRKFRDFLKGEYSEENILFWQAVEDLKRETDPAMVEERARMIYEDFISILSPKEVSLDSRVRDIVNKNMVEPSFDTFDEAQLQIYTLMHRDSYPRFINSPLYKQLLDETRPRGGGDTLREAAALAAATAATAASTAAAAAAAASSTGPNSTAIGSSRASITAANVLAGSIRQGSVSSTNQQLSNKRPNSRGTGPGGGVKVSTVVAGSVTSLRSAGGGGAVGSITAGGAGGAAASSSRHPVNKPKPSSSSISNAASSSVVTTTVAAGTPTTTAGHGSAITNIDPHSTGSATAPAVSASSSGAAMTLQR